VARKRAEINGNGQDHRRSKRRQPKVKGQAFYVRPDHSSIDDIIEIIEAAAEEP